MRGFWLGILNFADRPILVTGLRMNRIPPFSEESPSRSQKRGVPWLEVLTALALTILLAAAYFSSRMQSGPAFVPVPHPHAIAARAVTPGK